MAKGAYIGVSSKARKIIKGYVGVTTSVPIYDGKIETLNVTSSNISDVFTVTNSSYYFSGSGSTFTTSNSGVNSSTAQTVLTAKYDMDISFTYSYASEANYDKFTLIVGSSTIESAVSGTQTIKTYTGKLTKDSSITFMYTKDGSSHSNGDKCTFSDMIVKYDNRVISKYETKPIARKIKKAYIGVGGVARPCWIERLEYYGTITELSVARAKLAATTVGNYALFGGGTADELADYGTGTRDTVDAYNTSLTRSTPTTLTYDVFSLAATTVGNYAIFGGGSSNGTAAMTQVNAYDTSLTKSSPASLTTRRYGLAATTIGNYALFGGGDKNGSTTSGEVIAYNTSLTKSTPTALSSSRGGLAATSISNYALFGGGAANSRVDAYNASLTRSIPTALSVKRYFCSAASVGGNYALFAGGYAYTNGTSNYHASVDVYNTSLTKSTATSLSIGRNFATAVSIGDYALFAGGQGSTDALGTVDIYDAKLTRTIQHDLSIARYGASASAVGNYALVAGGCSNNGASSVVDVYEV